MSLGERMKHNYEHPFRYKLPNKMPVIIRIDGKSFHTLARRLGWSKPFDLSLIKNLQGMTVELCNNIMNVQLAYLQSDEISFLLVDYYEHQTQSWFDNEVQKLCSVTAGYASAKMSLKLGTEVVFDSRVFVIPPYEVCNYFIWRQKDWMRNSVQMLARAHFSQKQIHGLSNVELKLKIEEETDFSWDGLMTMYQRGSCVVKDEEWNVDNNIPIFTEDRDYINRFIPEVPDEHPIETFL